MARGEIRRGRMTFLHRDRIMDNLPLCHLQRLSSAEMIERHTCYYNQNQDKDCHRKRCSRKRPPNTLTGLLSPYNLVSPVKTQRMVHANHLYDVSSPD